MGDLPNTVGDLPNTLDGLPNTVGDLPNTVDDLLGPKKNHPTSREVVKLKVRKYAYLRIFSLTTSLSRKLILKAGLK